jgi:hypothetical protein
MVLRSTRRTDWPKKPPVKVGSGAASPGKAKSADEGDLAKEEPRHGRKRPGLY